MNLLALRTELNTDPAAIGYAGKSHEEIARLINDGSKRSIDDDSDRPTWQLWQCFEPSELLTLAADAVTPQKFKLLQLLCSLPSINPSAARLRPTIVNIFGTGSQSLSRFTAWAKRQGSRAEELKLGRVTESDVADALRS